MEDNWAIKEVAKKNKKSIRQFQYFDQEDLSDKIAEIVHAQADQILSKQFERKRRRAPLRDTTDQEMKKIKKILKDNGVEK